MLVVSHINAETQANMLSQTVFLIDLPRLADAGLNNQEAKERLTFFGKELLHFLEAMGLQEDVIRGVLNFDFSATKGLAFVHTMYETPSDCVGGSANLCCSGGSHTGQEWRRTGYCGLGTAVRELGLMHRGPVEVDFVVRGFNKSMLLLIDPVFSQGAATGY